MSLKPISKIEQLRVPLFKSFRSRTFCTEISFVLICVSFYRLLRRKFQPQSTNTEIFAFLWIQFHKTKIFLFGSKKHLFEEDTTFQKTNCIWNFVNTSWLIKWTGPTTLSSMFLSAWEWFLVNLPSTTSSARERAWSATKCPENHSSN